MITLMLGSSRTLRKARLGVVVRGGIVLEDDSERVNGSEASDAHGPSGLWRRQRMSATASLYMCHLRLTGAR